MCGGTSDAVAFEGQHNHLLASYNNQMGRPVAMNSSGVTGGVLADAVLVPAASQYPSELTQVYATS
jgi:hypothetical protein